MPPMLSWVVRKIVRSYDPEDWDGPWATERFGTDAVYIFENDIYGTSDYDDLDEEWGKLVRMTPIEALQRTIKDPSFEWHPVDELTATNGARGVVKRYKKALRANSDEVYVHSEWD